jgi:hypothetical protein
MFADLDADVSVLVDGNAAYDPPSAPLIGKPKGREAFRGYCEATVDLNGTP